MLKLNEEKERMRLTKKKDALRKRHPPRFFVWTTALSLIERRRQMLDA